MNVNLLFPVWLLSLWLISQTGMGQRKAEVQVASPATILWKITGKEGKQPSYLLGTFHLADAEWLYHSPEIKKVIDSTVFILTEAFTTEVPESSPPKVENPLKALSLLTKEQHRTLDSFFVARVGEGITGNPEAEAMSVSEMGNAILTTLAAGTTGANGLTTFMDLDLFKRYQQLGRRGDRLDRVAPTDFDAKDTDQAKQYLARLFNYLKNSDQPGWNIYQMKDVDKTVERYKKMQFDYQLDKQDENRQTATDFDYIPVQQRNKNWMPKIIAAISTRPCLIAVGLGHLYYRTGLIRLLREQGYRVDPVMLTKLP